MIPGVLRVIPREQVPRSWRLRSRCLGAEVDAFYPVAGNPDAAELARAICAECPVAAECLADAFNTAEVLGIRAGTTGRQRKRMLAEQGEKVTTCLGCAATMVVEAGTGRRPRYCTVECQEGSRRERKNRWSHEHPDDEEGEPCAMVG